MLYLIHLHLACALAITVTLYGNDYLRMSVIYRDLKPRQFTCALLQPRSDTLRIFGGSGKEFKTALTGDVDENTISVGTPIKGPNLELVG